MTSFWLSERTGVPVCPLLHQTLLLIFAVPKLLIISAKKTLLQTPLPTPRGSKAAKSAAARVWLLSSWDPANTDWVLQHLADNPGTERDVFSQMFTPPHSSHLPHFPSTSSSSPGFPHQQAHSSGVFCTDFLSLLSRDWSSSQIYHAISFISLTPHPHPLWHIGCGCLILAHDLCQQPLTPQRAQQQRECHPSVHKMFPGSYWVFLLQLPFAGLGGSSGSSAGLHLSITSPHGDESAPGFSPRGSSSWPWLVSVKHHASANPTP